MIHVAAFPTGETCASPPTFEALSYPPSHHGSSSSFSSFSSLFFPSSFGAIDATVIDDDTEYGLHVEDVEIWENSGFKMRTDGVLEEVIGQILDPFVNDPIAEVGNPVSELLRRRRRRQGAGGG